MDGFHDLGGRQGFGLVRLEGKQAPFDAGWERLASAFMGRLVRNHVFNMDEYRHAVERMEARHYISASYFERTFVAIATLCVEKGVVTEAEYQAVVGWELPLARPSKPGRTGTAPLPEISIGDTVRVKDETVGGHIRLPAYIRGKTGVVVAMSAPYPFPDAAAHGIAADKQRTFDVRFRSADLWSQDCDEAEVHVGVFHSYLEKVEAADHATTSAVQNTK